MENCSICRMPIPEPGRDLAPAEAADWCMCKPIGRIDIVLLDGERSRVLQWDTVPAMIFALETSSGQRQVYKRVMGNLAEKVFVYRQEPYAAIIPEQVVKDMGLLDTAVGK